MADKIKTTVASIFQELAEGLETGSFGKKNKIALTGTGSEHGEENAMKAAINAAKAGIDVYYIGTLEAEGVHTVQEADPDKGHDKMDEMLKSGEVDAAVTMHYPFPIGVSTVGRAVTPGKGKEMYLATTTGTTSAERIEGMIKNAVYGIAVAKACGNPAPTVGILNVDGARQTEMALKQLADGGYDIHFAESSRADGGCVLRGNDVLVGTPDVLVCDSLTGNVLSKMLSSYSTGGSYEALGSGYGPGIGEGYHQLVMIISRASGAPVVENALKFADELLKGDIFNVTEKEINAAKKAGLDDILNARKAAGEKSVAAEEVVAPPKEVVTYQIPGIEVMDLEDGVKALWKEKIYAESGMGCTGPVILVALENADKAREILKAAGYIG